MRLFLLSVLSLAALAQPTRVLVKRCMAGSCASLNVEGGRVRFTKTGRLSLARPVGEFVAGAQHLVPPTEAPIRLIRASNGYTVVVSAFLEEFDEYGPSIRVRVFGSGAILLLTDDADDEEHDVTRVELVRSGIDEMLALVVSGEHAYSVQTLVWLLPAHGAPVRVLDVNGALQEFQVGVGRPMRAVIERETYDGVDSGTIGRRRQSWLWDDRERAFTLPPGEGK